LRKPSTTGSNAPKENGPDGEHIVTASDDHTARTWYANIDDLLGAAKRLIQRDLPLFTPAERTRYGLE
jgi:hypothetical protein